MVTARTNLLRVHLLKRIQRTPVARLERLRRISNVRYWLTPGMGVKRHVFVAALGTLLLVIGVISSVLWIRHAEDYLLFGALEQRLASRVWEVWGGWLSLLTLLSGLSVAVWAVGRLNRSLLSNWMPRPKDAAVLLHQRVSLARGPRIVALGGGTGLSNLLRGLREYTSNITAVVSVSDDGGSSGRLRDAFGIPAPGDLTDCLAALSDNESQVSRLLEYRFERGAELEGHTFGNLFITTLTEVEGDFARAIRVLNALLNLCGAVYPITTDPTSLKVIKCSGEEVVGESKVSAVPGPVARVLLEPPDPAIVPDVAQALANADPRRFRTRQPLHEHLAASASTGRKKGAFRDASAHRLPLQRDDRAWRNRRLQRLGPRRSDLPTLGALPRSGAAQQQSSE